jgi:hypothetical protein
MLCYQYEDKRRVQYDTVKLEKDTSPSSLMDHLRIHHLQMNNERCSCSSPHQENIPGGFQRSDK